MPVAEEKTIGPTQCLEYLGMLLDFQEQVLTIPEKKRLTCLNLIDKITGKYRDRKTSTVKDIQKLAGHLNFICQAIPAGRTFMSGLYSLLAPSQGEKVRSGHHRRLNKIIHDDLVMFRSFLCEVAPEAHRSIPFLVKRNVMAEDIQLFADASGNKMLGVSCIFNDEWSVGYWRDTDIFQLTDNPNIAVLEMLAIVMAVELWAPRLAGSSIVLRSDSGATCGWLRSKKSDIPAVMNLLRHMTKTCLIFQIFISVKEITSKANRRADLISRDQVQQLLEEFPQMQSRPLPLPTTLWPPVWELKDMLPHKGTTQ